MNNEKSPLYLMKLKKNYFMKLTTYNKNEHSQISKRKKK